MMAQSVQCWRFAGDGAMERPTCEQSPTSATTENTRAVCPDSLARAVSSSTAASSFLRLRETMLTT